MKKYKIGYTTGVFDLFHIGHLNILKNAKALCDYLVVGVSTDETVLSYKGKKPVIPFDQRFAIVESIKYVDKVVPQTSMNKLEAWEQLHFDALFHGDDWKNTKMYEEICKQFKERNVDVVFLKHTEGISTSDILARIIDDKTKH